VTRVFNYL